MGTAVACTCHVNIYTCQQGEALVAEIHERKKLGK